MRWRWRAPPCCATNCPAGDARALLADALAGGFSLAMAVAGAASLAAAAMLALAARGEPALRAA